MLKTNHLLLCLLLLLIDSPIITAIEVVVSAKIDTEVNQADTSVLVLNRCSRRAKLYKINFGDGTTVSDSDYKNYSHKYQNLGKYTITMVVLDTVKSVVYSDTATATVEFTESSVACAADFQFAVDGYNVTVTNKSPGNFKRLIWYMGDGSIVKGRQSFTHTYNRQGAFDIRLYIKKSNIDCESEITKTVLIFEDQNYPVSQYEYFIDTANNVAFLNKSSGNNLKFQWTFGDGKSSTDENPSHKYSHSGIYKVYLKVIDNVTGNKSEFYENIRIPETDLNNIMPDFKFISDPEFDTVEFKNISIGKGNELYLWDFGDGEESTKPAPVHVYKSSGIYNVCLSISSTDGLKYNTTCKNVSAGIDKVLTPDFSYIINGYSVAFINTPNQAPDSVKWNFGDGSTSIEMQPIHDFKNEGIFLVSLDLYFKGQAYEALKIITTKVNPPDIIGRFIYYTLETKGGGSEVHFKSSLSGEVSRVKYVWDFGDGTKDSTSAEPYHEYATDGNYNVCLTVYNYETGSVDVSCNMVVIKTGNAIRSNYLNTNLSISPNPSNGNFNIKLYLDKSENVTVTLHDISGKIVGTLFRGKLISGLNTIDASVTLKKGIYVCKVSTNMNQMSQLLLIY